MKFDASALSFEGIEAGVLNTNESNLAQQTESELIPAGMPEMAQASVRMMFCSA
ncbi:MAG: hypothetical protein U0T81_09565 [Saprospiraceae bacterium]